MRFVESSRGFNQKEECGGFYIKYKNYGCSAPSGGAEHPKTPIVDIIAYCLNPNHYHLLVKQELENGISKFMQKLAGGYTRYFNNKYKRSGSLFQGKYKAKEIKSTYGFIKLSVYVSCNAEIHGIDKKEELVIKIIYLCARQVRRLPDTQ